MHGHNHLSAIFVTPFLVAARLGNHRKTMLAQNFDDFPCAANWIPAAHGTASSIIFAPLGNLTGTGLNQSASASVALATASASVSPAVAHPGTSGNTADHRFASGSNSTNKRNFIIRMIALVLHRGKPQATEVKRAEPDSEPFCSPVLRRDVVSTGDAERPAFVEASGSEVDCAP